MKYINYLKSKNLSKITINIYLNEKLKWIEYLKDREPNKILFTNYLKKCSKNHQPNSVRLTYSSIISFFKFEKRWNLINQCRDIKLPKIQEQNKSIISLNEFNEIEKKIKIDSLRERRNWLIFCFLFFTGMRVSEVIQFNKNLIFDRNKIQITGKGNKMRVVYLPEYLMNLLNDWDYQKISLNNRKVITSRQINLIIKKIGFVYFEKEITPHSLRRSFVTNLLRNKANIEIVRKALGHENINTTARYLNFNDDEMIEEINRVFQHKK